MSQFLAGPILPGGSDGSNRLETWVFTVDQTGDAITKL